MKKTAVIGFITLVVISLLRGNAVCRTLVPEETPPPEYPIRVAAEWEPAIGVLIGWPLMVPQELVKEIAKDDAVYLLVANEVRKIQAQYMLSLWGIDDTKVHYIIDRLPGTNHAYPRDWGPFTVFDGNGEAGLIDYWFAGYPVGSSESDQISLGSPEMFTPRADEAPEYIARYLDIPNYEVPVNFTGGNVMLDGHGGGFSTQLLINENETRGVTEEEFYQYLEEYMGISDYHIVNNFEQQAGIQHIDCLLKLLDEETLLVKRVPESHPDYNNIEAIVDEIETLTTPHGRPYRIIRIDCPPYKESQAAGYTNALILNKKVFVPLFGISADEEALATYRSAMPGYAVIGFPYPQSDRGGQYGWSYTDALHCRTRAVWDPEMLYLSHKRIEEQAPASSSYSIEVKIRDYSGEGLIEDQLKVFYRFNSEGDWLEVSLNSSNEQYMYAASIPSRPDIHSIDYYITAADRSGRHESLPRTAPDGFYGFSINE